MAEWETTKSYGPMRKPWMTADEPKPPAERILACGCISCVCLDEEYCFGCGAGHCFKHSPEGQAEALRLWKRKKKQAGK